jgi:hypothetical protein
VGAALKATVYSKLMNSGTAQWGEVGTSVIDNLAYTAATPSMTFVVNTGNYYAIKLQGEAHLLMPGDEIEVKVQLLVNGVPIAACPQPDPAKGNVAGLVGMLYLQVGD